uniref:Uncharacterized protein n=1 Tax=Rhizophagus irregularis (strain DAOM 181602 / DAOM 197198 / MUCL 43194) TaxID=747089 RepID=U9SN51_RHIID
MFHLAIILLRWPVQKCSKSVSCCHERKHYGRTKFMLSNQGNLYNFNLQLEKPKKVKSSSEFIIII